jgi:L-ascorbate metabolism protein UlaG (beta-lactamase superfamily)
MTTRFSSEGGDPGGPLVRGLRLCSVLIAVCITACASSPAHLPLVPGGPHMTASDPAYGTTLQVRYLGAGGVLFQRGADLIVTAPFFSNPSLLRVIAARIRANSRESDHFLGPLAVDIQDTPAILVGHAHYDHLMDLPYIRTTYLAKARIYGSDTAKYILAAYPSLAPNDVVSVEHDMGDAQHVGKWWKVTSRVRFMALKSAHAPVFLHEQFSPGEYDRPLTKIPSSAFEWREGQTLAYVIDFLDDTGRVDFRIHYQDAASTPPLGFPPDDVIAESHRVDLAVLCLPGFDQVDGYPEAIVTRLNPRFVLGIHWENFFEPIPDDPRQLHLVPAFDADEFVARLNKVLPSDATFLVTAPETWLQIPK